MTSVPVNVSGYGYASMTGNDGGGNAELRVLFGSQYSGQIGPIAGTNLQNYDFQALVNNNTSSSSFSVNGVYTAPVNTPFLVILNASARVNAYIYQSGVPPYPLIGNTPVYANAYVDPVFSLTSDEVNSGLYSIVTSAGVGNSSLPAPGPTPGAGLVSLAFLALMGAAARRIRIFSAVYRSRKLVKSFKLGLAAALSLVVSGAYAQAVTPPPAQWVGGMTKAQGNDTGNSWDPTLNSEPAPGPGSYSSSVSGGFGSSSATLTQGPLPSPYLSASAFGSAVLTNSGWPSSAYSYSYSSLDYWVEITGPASVTSVPINVSGYGYATSTGPDSESYAYAELRVLFGYQYSPYFGEIINPAFQNYDFQASAVDSTRSFSANGVYMAPVNTPFLVILDANAGAQATVYGSGYPPYSIIYDTPQSANAYVDPVFSLTSDEANSGLYSIVTSAGVGNSSLPAPGPTPGAGLVSLAFLALMGAAARVRRLSAR